MSTKAYHPAAAFGIAIAFALMCGWITVSVSDSKATQPHISVTGTLAEATTVGGRKSPALQLRLNEEPLNFRLDPALFREAMHRDVPAELQRGARISVLVLQEEYAHPSTPPLGHSARIVWFHGLTIGDREVFGLAQARAWEIENQRWCYALLAISLLGVVYYGVKWLRTRT